MSTIRGCTVTMLLALCACGENDSRPSGNMQREERDHPDPPPLEPPRRAEASLRTDDQPELVGKVILQALPPDGVRVDATFAGLEPDSVHGLHVREGRDCSDSAAAFPHFDGDRRHPAFKSGEERTHGDPVSIQSHLGDLGNVVADAAGEAQITSLVRGELRLDEPNGAYDVLHRVVVLQRGEDDYVSENPDNSGGVLACATIELVVSE
jgi:Cu-Zn family superoxide dismutase